MNIDELWEAFIENDMKLTLKIQSEEAVEMVRKGLSNYKHRLYSKDPEMEELFGVWRFKFELREKLDAQGEVLHWQLHITTTQDDRPTLDVEIVEEGDK